jgi:hypothetical protein
MAVNLHATHFRFGNDDGTTEANHTFKANEDVSISQIKDVTFLLRIMVQETGGAAASNVDFQFQCARNGGAFQNITTTSTICKAVTAVSYADAANTTKRLTGTGTFESSSAGCTEDGLAGGNNNDMAASGCSETVCALQIVGANTADGDSITFRLTSPDFTITNDVVPTVTVLHNVSADPGVGAITVTGFAPTVTATNNANSAPGVGTVTLEGFAPTVQTPQNSTPGVGALVVTGFAPTVDASSGINITPGVGAVLVTGFAPTIVTPQNAAPGLGEVLATGFAPTVVTPQNSIPGLGSVTLIGFEPTVTIAPVGGGDAPDDGDIESSPGLGSIIINGFAPTVDITNWPVRYLGSGGGVGKGPMRGKITKGFYKVEDRDKGPKQQLLEQLKKQSESDVRDIGRFL